MAQPLQRKVVARERGKSAILDECLMMLEEDQREPDDAETAHAAEEVLVPYPIESALSGIQRHEERMLITISAS